MSSPPAPPTLPDPRAALAALADLEGAAAFLRHALTCTPTVAPEVLARLAGLLEATAQDLEVWATWLTLPEDAHD
jgi:hypothetical protein